MPFATAAIAGGTQGLRWWAGPCTLRRRYGSPGAPARETEDATAMLLSLSGAHASLPLHDHGLALDRIPDVIANTVELIVNQLRQQVVAPQV